MSELIVIGYPDEVTASNVLGELQDLERDYLVDLDDAAVITRGMNGKLKVTTTDHMVATGAIGGAFWGMLIGLLFLAPWAGAAIGALIGGSSGALARIGIKEDFRERVEDLVSPGTSAILAVVRRATPDKVLDAIQPYGGTILRTSLSHEQEEKLMTALMGEKKAA